MDELHPIDGRGIRGDPFWPKCRRGQGCALLADLDKAPASQRLAGEHNTPGTRAFIGVVVTLGPARLPWYRHKHIAPALTRSCSTTEDGTSTLLRLCVQLQDICPRPKGVAGQVPDAPAVDSPRLQGVFWSAVRTAARDMASMTWSATSFAASHWRGHRPDPSGGAAQASMVSEASTRPSILDGAPLRRLSWRAWANPPS